MFDQLSKLQNNLRSNRKVRIAFSTIRLVIFTITLFLIVRYFLTNVARFYAFPTINFFLVSLFFIMLILIQIIYSLFWKIFVDGFGRKISFRNAFFSTYYPVLTKYLPGKGWFQLDRIYALKKFGIEPSTGLTINILEQIIVIYTGLLVSMPLFFKIVHPLYVVLILVTATILMFYLLLHQDSFAKMITRVGRFFKMSKSVIFTYKIRPKTIFLFIFLYTTNWILWGLIFKLSISILDETNSLSIGMSTGAFSFSSILGFIIPVAPAGLGIREGALLVFLEKQVNPAALFNATIGIRLCTIIGEVLMFLIALCLKARMKID